MNTTHRTHRLPVTLAGLAAAALAGARPRRHDARL